MKNASYIYHSNDLQKLREDMHRALDFRFDEFQKNSKLSEILPSNNKIEWLRGDMILSVFFELLIEHEYVDCNLDFFQAHFIGGNTVTLPKIIFLQPTNQLPYILDCLQDEGYIAICENPHIRLAQHFLNRFSKPISNTVLRSSLNKGVGKKAKQFIEENIMNKLKKTLVDAVDATFFL